MNVENKNTRSFQNKPMSEINVTPFVDVMLVLLIIFMITAPLLTSGVSVDSVSYTHLRAHETREDRG